MTQRFTLDLGGSGHTGRRPGFETGQYARVRWTYRNRATRWPQSSRSHHPQHNALFGGQEVPAIWTGELTAEVSWTVPP